MAIVCQQTAVLVVTMYDHYAACCVPLRIDKGYQRGALNLSRRFKTIIDVIIYYRYSERVYFSLFNDAYLILIDQDLREL